METLSNNKKLLVTSVLAIGLAGAPLLAQSSQEEREQGKQEKHAKPKIEIVKHDAIMGAVVTNGAEGKKRQKLGSISDLVFDARDGRLRYAVLETGGTLGVGKRRTAIAWNSFKWDGENKQLELSMTADVLERLPKFDPENLRRLGQGPADADGKKGNGKRGDRVGGRRGTSDNGGGHWTPPSLMLASKIDDCAVLAGKDKIGAGDTLYLEPKSGCVAFLTVTTGGVLGIGETDYVVPWAALRLVKPIGKQELEIQLSKGKEALKTAPKLSDKDADVSKPKFRSKVYEFYNVKRPGFEPKDAKKAQGGL